MRIRDIRQKLPKFRYQADIAREFNQDADSFIPLTCVARNG
jgi:hypothetical protein